MEVKNITPEMILLALGVFLALAAAIVGADKFFDVIKKWRKPREQTDQTLARCQLDLNNQKARADSQAEEIKALRAGLIVTCQGVKALIEHELHNGNKDEMETASGAIDKWIFERVR